jgi:hypothetical protein
MSQNSNKSATSKRSKLSRQHSLPASNANIASVNLFETLNQSATRSGVEFKGQSSDKPAVSMNKAMKQEMAQLISEGNANLKTDLEKIITDSIDDLKKDWGPRLLKVETDVGTNTEEIRKLKQSFAALQGENRKLTQRLDNAEKRIDAGETHAGKKDGYDRREILEISGVPVKKDRLASAVLKTVCDHLGVDIPDSEFISEPHFVDIEKDGRIVKQFTVVKMLRRKYIDMLKSKAKEKLPTVEGLHLHGDQPMEARFDGGEHPVFVGEQMSPYFRKLRYLVKEAAREAGFTGGVYHYRERIYAKRHKEDKKAVMIRHVSEIATRIPHR